MGFFATLPADVQASLIAEGYGPPAPLQSYASDPAPPPPSPAPPPMPPAALDATLARMAAHAPAARPSVFGPPMAPPQAPMSAPAPPPVAAPAALDAALGSLANAHSAPPRTALSGMPPMAPPRSPLESGPEAPPRHGPMAGGYVGGTPVGAGETAGNRYANGGGAGGGVPGEAAAPRDVNWGGGGGGSATIPAHEQALVMPARQRALTGAIDAEAAAIEAQKTAVGGSADAAAEIERQRAIGTQEIARAAEDAGIDVKLRAKARADESKAFREHIDAYAAKLAEDKIDPNRMWNSASTGQQITWSIAKALGAVGQAFLGQSTNQVADHIERMAAQDVAAQKANHDIGRERLSDMHSMYSQALQASGSAEEADRVATGYALEAAKQNAAALTQSATSKAQKAKGEELQAALIEKQAIIGEKKAETEIKLNPLVQARTVSTGPDMAKLGKQALDLQLDYAKIGKEVSYDQAFAAVMKSHTGQTVRGFAPVQGAKAEPGGKDEKMNEARTEVEGGLKMIDNALETGAAYKQGPIGALWSHVPGATDSKIDKLERDKYNAQVKAVVGAGWKLVTSGMEPKNPSIIEELSEHYQVHPSDSDTLARAKMGALKNMLKDAAGSKGVLYDTSKSGVVAPPTFAK